MMRSIAIVLLAAIAVFMAAIWIGGRRAETPATTPEEEMEAYPLRIVDDMGREMVLPSMPQSIVSLAPSNTEILFALGAGDRVVGVTDYCDFPAEVQGIDRVGGFADPSVEVIVSLRPDLVLATSMHQQQVEQLDSLGVKVMVLFPKDIDDVLRSIRMVGEAIGGERQAQALVETTRGRIEAVTERLETVEARPLVYYEVFSDPLMSAGPGTLIHQIIQAGGGINMAGDADTDYPQYSAEAVIDRNPDVIIFPAYHGTDALTEEQLLARPGWQEIGALKNRRYHSIDANIISRPGPRIAEAVEILATMLHPELFQ
jgi:iron complex transport system substrate-binding protein